MDGSEAVMDTRDVVIEVRQVKKAFRSYRDKATSLKERFVNPSRGRHENVDVLKGVSFQMARGEAVGIIGKNGCGKSTTLKLLARILYPNEGSIEIKGRVSSLIELGAGFHPDMTGRENIYTNATIFGITRKEVDTRLNDIIRFSELEEYIDSPVRTYSSGMYMRLAFAVAINVDADVLLIDEILAVGDSAFQKKCFEKLQEIKACGTTIVIVSHSMDQLYKICDRLIWLEDGLVRDEGTPRFIGEEYLAAMEGRRLSRIDFENQQKKAELEHRIQKEQERQHREQEKEQQPQAERQQKELDAQQRREELARMEQEKREMDVNETTKSLTKYWRPGARRSGDFQIHYIKVRLLDSKGKETNLLYTGQRYSLCMEYEGMAEGIHTKCVIGFTRADGIYCYGTSINMDSSREQKLLKKGQIIFSFINELLKGSYVLDLWLNTAEGHEYDCIYSLMQFEVETVPYQERGIFTMAHEWNVDGTAYLQ